uniref:t-SNARE coiled-coil homology domain-containing protein n=1 Tax=Quercus lobata TaxID=97700 RepID=A0A7N2KLJ5_QUELO
MISGSVKVQLFEGNTELDLMRKERHEALMDIQRSLTKLHQIFLDMAVLVETQGEKIGTRSENHLVIVQRLVVGEARGRDFAL